MLLTQAPPLTIPDEAAQLLKKQVGMSTEILGVLSVLENLLATSETLSEYLTPHYSDDKVHKYRRAHYALQKAKNDARETLRQTGLAVVK